MKALNRIIILVIACLPVLCMAMVMEIAATQLAELAVVGITGLFSLIKALS